MPLSKWRTEVRIAILQLQNTNSNLTVSAQVGISGNTIVILLILYVSKWILFVIVNAHNGQQKLSFILASVQISCSTFGHSAVTACEVACYGLTGRLRKRKQVELEGK